MKTVIILSLILLAGCGHVPKTVIPPSTAYVKSSIGKAQTSVDTAQVSNQQSLDAISRAEVTTMSLKEKLELLKTFNK